MHTTKEPLFDIGLRRLLEQSYNALGIATLLKEGGVPKGSFYHHFDNKQDFALQVVDRYMDEVHRGLSACLGDGSRPARQRVRGFFGATREKYAQDGYLGCMPGGLGQELSGVNEVLRLRIQGRLRDIGDQNAACLEAGQQRGEQPG